MSFRIVETIKTEKEKREKLQKGDIICNTLTNEIFVFDNLEHKNSIILFTQYEIITKLIQ